MKSIAVFLLGTIVASQAVEIAQKGYHALIMENTKSVTVMPPIQVSGQACSFDLTWEHASGREDDPPFTIDDKEPSEPKIIPTKEPNCELQRYYRLQLLAYDCEPGKAVGNATVHITVEDENEFEPEFTEGAYQATARENHMHISPPILQVTARDKDCTPKKSDICKYEIVSPDDDKAAPFQIDAEGNIRNTRPLVYEDSHNYIFEVVAYDCSMKQSKPVSVSITVQKECHMQWSSIAQEIDYTGGSVSLYGNAQLDTCPSDCEIDEIFSKIQLDTKHIGKGCDRDTYSVRSQRKLCNANTSVGSLTTLLGMDASQVSKSGASSKAPTQDKGDENSPIYFFDGKTNALLLPRDTFHQTKTMAVQFWMKHQQNVDKKAKEHIVCTSDSHKMNRHHFSVFLHNCHLVLLVRQHNSNYHKLFPAEFRWRVSEVCDFEWHHYTINLDGDQATLYIDGKAASTADIVDDWPIHKNIHVGNETTTVVGACWQAKQSHMAMHFKGYLSDLVVLNNATEQEQVLKCMYQCKESLVRANGDNEEPLSDVETLSGDSVESIERQIARINYKNNRHNPTPGNRMVHLYTHVKCTNGQSKKLPMVETIIAVKNNDAPEEPKIQISSEEHNIAKEYGPIKEGVDIFETINIKVQPGENIDSCTIQVFPALNPDHETLQVPEYVLDKMGLAKDDTTSQQNQQQIKLRGPASSENFQKVISEISYYNKKPAYYLNRAFKLQCYEMGTRFASNEYIQTLTVIHPSSVASSNNPVAAKLTQNAQSHPAPKHHPQHQRSSIKEKHSNSSSIGIATVVVGGLVGTVLIMLGVMRRRREKATAAAGQLQWDDSALTITVNPLSSEDWEQCNGCVDNADDSSGDSSCAESDDSDDEGKHAN